MYGGGHRPYRSGELDRGYDCSGAVSYALYGGPLPALPAAERDVDEMGLARPGRWITVYAHGGHAYVVVAGYRFDTSMHDRDAPEPGHGPALEPHAPPGRPPSWRATLPATRPRALVYPKSARPAKWSVTSGRVSS